MYNMEIVCLKNMEVTLFGYKFRLEIVILIVIAYWILWGHVLCSCSKFNLMEGVHNMYNSQINRKSFKYETNKDVIPMIGTGKTLEGFVGANTNYGESSKFSLTNDKPVNTSSWFTQDLTYTKGTTGGPGVQYILNRPKQPIPLPEGVLSMFANTPFTPECGPNACSNTPGGACMTVDQYTYLIDRGGNNVPYSEY
jgi:hypothetical protein